MGSGRRDRRVTFERYTATVNGLNEDVRTWAELCTEWASREDVSDAEMVAAGELGAALGARFVVPCNSLTATLTPRDRILHDGARWDIKAVREVRGAPRRLIEVRAAREV